MTYFEKRGRVDEPGVHILSENRKHKEINPPRVSRR